MHNLAICLKKRGNDVTGSDDMFFEPAKTHLKEHGLLPQNEGWDASKITRKIDLVILGMHAKADNPELLSAQRLGLKVYSFPQFIFEVSRNKKRLVIAGSHGKTTITAMIMHVLKSVGFDFDYLVGAQLEGFCQMVQISEAPVMLIEGDEYTSSALDPRPKFLHYRHHLAVISGVDWDHYNVYPTPEHYIAAFRKFVQQTPPDGKVFYAKTDKKLRELAQQNSLYNLLAYGPHPSETKNQQTALMYNGKHLPMGVFGQHNMQNLEAARLMLNEIGVSDTQFYQHIPTFSGASRRMEKIGENEQTTIFKDFAHAPSKLKATCEAVKEQFKSRQLVACIELHSFSSLSKGFIGQYKDTFNAPDQAILFTDPKIVAAKQLEMFSEEEIRLAFNRSDIILHTDAKRLEKDLLTQNWAGKNLLLMSSGNYGGLNLEKIKRVII